MGFQYLVVFLTTVFRWKLVFPLNTRLSLAVGRQRRDVIINSMNSSTMTETGENVTRMEDILKEKEYAPSDANPEKKGKTKKSTNQTNVLEHVPKGKPKSGRIWKEPRTRFSSIIKSRGIRLSYEKKQKLRNDLKHVKELSRAVVAQRRTEKELKKQRRRENLKRAEENRKKNEIVQVIKNTAKLKNMKKKHLRKLEKRDTTNM